MEVARDEAGMKDRLHELLVVKRLSLRAAGEELGYSAVHVFRVAKELEVEGRRRHRAKNRRHEIYEMRVNGKSFREIAEQVGCAVRTVQAIVKDYQRHQLNEAVGVVDDGPFTRQQWGDDDGYDVAQPLEVKPYRCPRHGLMRLRPCLICAAEDARQKSGRCF